MEQTWDEKSAALMAAPTAAQRADETAVRLVVWLVASTDVMLAALMVDSSVDQRVALKAELVAGRKVHS